MVRRRNMKIPNRLIINDGKITLEDGSDATSYLRDWMKKHKIGKGAVVNVITRKELAEIYEELWEQRNLAQAA
jgi:hypothetical protein